jgi:rSAM/selenodomain-associated transferase 2
MAGCDENTALAVIIPTLNEERTIEACLESVGDDCVLEIVVVDGGSTDTTCRLAAAAGARVVESERGRGHQLNRGAEVTSAPRLIFVHADCLLPPNWVEPLGDALDDEGTSLACYRLRTTSARDRRGSVFSTLALRVFDLRSRGSRLPYGDQGFAVRREVFDRVGGFPDQVLMEDIAFARACRARGRIRRLPLEMRTTARRLEERPVRTMLAYSTFPTLYRLGVSPTRLAKWYGDSR